MAFTAILFSIALKNVEFKQPQPPLIPFSADIHFDPFPSYIDISNEYPCTPEQPRTCDTTNQFSCIGCQSLLARCIHLEKPTTYIDASNNTIILPPNSTPTEGYCLTISDTNLNLFCNPFHGELALIQLTPTSPEVMFFCNCLNPGLIGNTNILGTCTTPFICDGQIDDINQPLENIKCICSNSQISTRNNNIPVCRTITVGEAIDQNKLDSLRPPNIQFDQFIHINHFEESIRDLLRPSTAILPSPCARCPVTGKPIHNARLGMDHLASPVSSYCTVDHNVRTPESEQESVFFGIPIRRSPDERLLAGPSGPDAILAVYWHTIFVYHDITPIPENSSTLVYIFSHRLNEQFYANLNLDPTKQYTIATPDTRLGIHIPIPPTSPTDNIPATFCSSLGPLFHRCKWRPDWMGFNPADIRTERINAWIYTIPSISNNQNITRIRMYQNAPLIGLRQWQAMQEFNDHRHFDQTRQMVQMPPFLYNASNEYVMAIAPIVMSYTTNAVQEPHLARLTYYTTSVIEDHRLFINRIIPPIENSDVDTSATIQEI